MSTRDTGGGTLPHDRWLSPLSYRYGSAAMRALWGEVEKRKTWRRVWVALARAQAELGLFDRALVTELEAKVDAIDVEAAHTLEAELRHDLVAELRVFAGQCPRGGRVLHLGATSMDIEDNADVLRMKRGLGLLLGALDRLLASLAAQIDALADHVTMGMTHLQPAEPTTLGYRLAQYAQDLLEDRKALVSVAASLRGKGMKGAVGTSASYAELFAELATVHEMERLAMAELGLDSFLVATQTYPRKQDLGVVDVLASLGQSLYRFAFDLRLMQSPLSGEVSEPFGERQIGSSAMPFKRNPVAAENIDSLARQLAALPRIAWDNAAHCHLERTLDDSANRRSLLPEAFLLSDAILSRATAVIDDLRVEPAASERLLSRFGVFAATEKVLMEATRAGGDRQVLHEVLRDHAMSAWAAMSQGGDNPLAALVASDPRLLALVPRERLVVLLDARTHIGDAPLRARRLADQIRLALAS